MPVDQILKHLDNNSSPALPLMRTKYSPEQLRQITPSILNLNHSQITHVLLYGDSSLKNETNTEILNSTMNYILSTKMFEGSFYKR